MNNETTTTSADHTESERSPLARRGLFAAAAGGFAAIAAVATSSGGVRAARPGRPAPSQVDEPTDGDLAVAGVAAGLEVLAVNTYTAALVAAGSGILGAVPPAVGEFVTTAKAHHEAARDAWNGVLSAAGMPEVTAPPADLDATVTQMFGMVTDIAGAAQLALTLEQIAAATYLSALGSLESTPAIALAGSIQTIDRQHVAVLLFALGMYPVPEVFASVDMAYTGNGMPAAATAMVPETS